MGFVVVAFFRGWLESFVCWETLFEVLCCVWTMPASEIFQYHFISYWWLLFRESTIVLT